jgi:L-asparaginase
MRPRLVILTTGGTIACKDDPVLGVVPSLDGQALLDALLEAGDVADVEVDDFSKVPSDYMGPAEWHRLARRVTQHLDRPDIAGVVLTHGTDTLEETAFFLDLTVPGDKPVVVSGAQRLATVPDSDGPRNLRDAVRVAAAPASRGLGVLVVMGGTIHAARDATKTHTHAVAAFSSGDFGPLGTVDEGRVLIRRCPAGRLLLTLGERVPRVEIVPMYGGADGGQLASALAAGAGALVIQALGRGNVNRELHQGVVAAIRQGVPVVITSRVPVGRTEPVYDFVGGGRSLAEAGAIFGGDLSPQKARVLLLVAGSTTLEPGRLREILIRLDSPLDSGDADQRGVTA